jgi:hypothetical protein
LAVTLGSRFEPSGVKSALPEPYVMELAELGTRVAAEFVVNNCSITSGPRTSMTTVAG